MNILYTQLIKEYKLINGYLATDKNGWVCWHSEEPLCCEDNFYSPYSIELEQVEFNYDWIKSVYKIKNKE